MHGQSSFTSGTSTTSVLLWPTVDGGILQPRRCTVALRGGVALRRLRRWSDPTVADPAWDFLTVEFWAPTGLERIEAFDVDQEAEARARLAELGQVHRESVSSDGASQPQNPDE